MTSPSTDSKRALDAWYARPIGRQLRQVEEACLAELVKDLFGYYLVQVGAPMCFRDALARTRVRQSRFIATPSCSTSAGADMVAEPTALPIAGDSLDALVLVHTLDICDDPHQVLREAERVLIGDGRVIVLGFNALSLWGVRSLLRGRRERTPWSGRFVTSSRVTDWLALLGFEIEEQRMLMFRPPMRGAFGSQFAWLDRLGQRWWPFFGGVYALRAVKRQRILTPIRPAWSRRSVLAPGVTPTTRSGTHG